MHLLLEVRTDGCTYTSAHALVAFTDGSVADLVATELNDKFESPSCGYEVQFVPVNKADDEDAIAGIVAALVLKHRIGS